MPGSAKRNPLTHVYDPDGTWRGFFHSLQAAIKWVGRRKGFVITDRAPERSTEKETTVQISAETTGARAIPKEPDLGTRALVDAGLNEALESVSPDPNGETP